MKKWMKFIIVSVLLLTVFSPLSAMAKNAGEVKLTQVENSNDVSVSVDLGLNGEAVTSLRLKLYVEVDEGEIAEENGIAFQFATGGSQAEAFIEPMGSEYLIDLIISGAANLVGSDGTISVGTLKIGSKDPENFYAEVGVQSDDDPADSEIADGETADVVPMVEYVAATGLQAQKVQITNADTLVLGKEPETQPETPEGSGGSGSGDSGKEEGSGSEGGANPEKTPGLPQPDTSDSGDRGITETEPETLPNINAPVVVPIGEGSDLNSDGSETVPFDQAKVPALKVKQTLAGSSIVSFRWGKIPGADGFEIVQVSAGKEKVIKVVLAGEGTSYEKTLGYGKSYRFKIRAFKLEADNVTKVYGADSKEISVTTPDRSLGRPKVTARAVKKTNSIKVSWKKVKNAEGYKVYLLDEATGKFKSIKTINKSDVTTYTVEKDYGKTYTFRVIAFKKNTSGKGKVYGNYSYNASATTAPATIKRLAAKVKAGPRVRVTWRKDTQVKGYQVYRKTGANGKYVRIKTIKKAGTRKFIDTSVESGKTYYYKVRSFVTGSDGKKVYGTFSAEKKAVIK